MTIKYLKTLNRLAENAGLTPHETDELLQIILGEEYNWFVWEPFEVERIRGLMVRISILRGVIE